MESMPEPYSEAESRRWRPPGPPNKALKPTTLLVTLLARRKKRAKPVGPHSPTGQGGGLAWTLGGPRFSRENGRRPNQEAQQQITSPTRIEPINHDSYRSEERRVGKE